MAVGFGDGNEMRRVSMCEQFVPPGRVQRYVDPSPCPTRPPRRLAMHSVIPAIIQELPKCTTLKYEVFLAERASHREVKVALSRANVSGAVDRKSRSSEAKKNPAAFLDCVSMVLGVKNYLTDMPHAPRAGTCLPKFSLPSCYQSFSQSPILAVQFAKILRRICRILFASPIIVPSTKAGITHIPPSTDSKELSRKKSRTWKSLYVLCFTTFGVTLRKRWFQDAPTIQTDEAGPSTQLGPAVTSQSQPAVNEQADEDLTNLAVVVDDLDSTTSGSGTPRDSVDLVIARFCFSNAATSRSVQSEQSILRGEGDFPAQPPTPTCHMS
ncbi:hypothetical protein BC826DRAFT_968178 [Russula brevipes]|nr:hypothetical protein BC826DRAFT_968178 [Russula brevipes]